MPEITKTVLAHSYLLRIWFERDESATAGSYRFGLVDPHTHERYSFDSVAQLAAFLEDWQRLRGSPPDRHERP